MQLSHEEERKTQVLQLTEQLPKHSPQQKELVEEDRETGAPSCADEVVGPLSPPAKRRRRRRRTFGRRRKVAAAKLNRQRPAILESSSEDLLPTLPLSPLPAAGSAATEAEGMVEEGPEEGRNCEHISENQEEVGLMVGEWAETHTKTQPQDDDAAWSKELDVVPGMHEFEVVPPTPPEPLAVEETERQTSRLTEGGFPLAAEKTTILIPEPELYAIDDPLPMELSVATAREEVQRSPLLGMKIPYEVEFLQEVPQNMWSRGRGKRGRGQKSDQLKKVPLIRHGGVSRRGRGRGRGRGRRKKAVVEKELPLDQHSSLTVGEEAFTGLQSPQDSPSKTEGVAAISSERKSHSGSPEIPLQNSSMPLPRTGVRKRGSRSLESIVNSLKEGGPRSCPTKVAETQAMVADTQAKAAEAQTKAADTQAKAADTQAKAAEAQTKAADTQAKAADTQAKAAEAQTKVADTQTKVADTQTKAADTQAKAADTQAKAAEAQTKAADTQTKAADTQAMVADTQTKAAESQTKAADTQTKVADTQTKAADTQTKAAEAQTKAADTQTVTSSGAGDNITVVVVESANSSRPPSPAIASGIEEKTKKHVDSNVDTQIPGAQRQVQTGVRSSDGTRATAGTELKSSPTLGKLSGDSEPSSAVASTTTAVSGGDISQDFSLGQPLKRTPRRGRGGRRGRGRRGQRGKRIAVARPADVQPTTGDLAPALLQEIPPTVHTVSREDGGQCREEAGRGGERSLEGSVGVEGQEEMQVETQLTDWVTFAAEVAKVPLLHETESHTASAEVKVRNPTPSPAKSERLPSEEVIACEPAIEELPTSMAPKEDVGNASPTDRPVPSKMEATETADLVQTGVRSSDGTRATAGTELKSSPTLGKLSGDSEPSSAVASTTTAVSGGDISQDFSLGQPQGTKTSRGRGGKRGRGRRGLGQSQEVLKNKSRGSARKGRLRGRGRRGRGLGREVAAVPLLEDWTTAATASAVLSDVIKQPVKDPSPELLAAAEVEVRVPSPSPAEVQNPIPPPAEVSDSTPPPAEVQDPTPPPAEVQDPTAPPAEVQDPTPPPAEVQDPTPPPTEVQDPTPPPAEVQDPTAPPAEVQDPTPSPAEVQDPTPPPAEVQNPTPPPAEVQDPTAPPAEVQDPTPPPAEVQDPTPPQVELQELTPPPAEVQDPTSSPGKSERLPSEEEVITCEPAIEELPTSMAPKEDVGNAPPTDRPVPSKMEATETADLVQTGVRSSDGTRATAGTELKSSPTLGKLSGDSEPSSAMASTTTAVSGGDISQDFSLGQPQGTKTSRGRGGKRGRGRRGLGQSQEVLKNKSRGGARRGQPRGRGRRGRGLGREVAAVPLLEDWTTAATASAVLSDVTKQPVKDPSPELLAAAEVEVRVPSPPPAAMQVPTPPPAEVQDPTPPPAEVQVPTPPPAEVQKPTPPPAEVSDSTPPPAEVQNPTSSPAEVQDPTPSPAEVQNPTPPIAEYKRSAEKAAILCESAIQQPPTSESPPTPQSPMAPEGERAVTCDSAGETSEQLPSSNSLKEGTGDDLANDPSSPSEMEACAVPVETDQRVEAGNSPSSGADLTSAPAPAVRDRAAVCAGSSVPVTHPEREVQTTAGGDMMMESGCGLQTSQQVNLATGLGHPNPPRKATSFAANNTTVREKSVSFASRDLTAPPAKRRKTLLSKKARDASVSHLSVKDSEVGLGTCMVWE